MSSDDDDYKKHTKSAPTGESSNKKPNDGGNDDDGNVISFQDAERLLKMKIKAQNPAKSSKTITDQNVIGTFYTAQLDLAKHVMDLYGMNYTFVRELKEWFKWNGFKWMESSGSEVFNHICDVSQKLFGDNEKLANKMLSYSQLKGVEMLCRHDPRVMQSLLDFDAQDELLNTPSGIIQLMPKHIVDGEHWRVIQTERDFLCSRSTSVAPDGDCPLWIQFLRDVTGENDDLLAYLQVICGYSLMAGNPKSVLFFFYGKGSNGKSTFLRVLLDIIDDYAEVANMEKFMAQTHVSAGATPELISLKGARLVVCNEVNEDRRWDEALIKTLTGGDAITARPLYGKPVKFTPAFALIFAGNHKPQIKSLDHGITRRIQLIPFTVTIPEEKINVDLPEQLRAEYPAIFKWMLKGYTKYIQNGLKPPLIVLNSTSEYFEDEDSFGAWLDEYCELRADFREPVGALFSSWAQYAKESHLPSGSLKSFSIKLSNKGFGRERTNASRFITGLQLRPRASNFGGELQDY